jgi:hypothetical protein
MPEEADDNVRIAITNEIVHYVANRKELHLTALSMFILGVLKKHRVTGKPPARTPSPPRC